MSEIHLRSAMRRPSHTVEFIVILTMILACRGNPGKYASYKQQIVYEEIMREIGDKPIMPRNLNSPFWEFLCIGRFRIHL